MSSLTRRTVRDSLSVAITVGTYGVTMPNELTAGYDSYDATCNDTSGGEQTAGQVVLCSVGPKR